MGVTVNMIAHELRGLFDVVVQRTHDAKQFEDVQLLCANATDFGIMYVAGAQDVAPNADERLCLIYPSGHADEALRDHASIIVDNTRTVQELFSALQTIFLKYRRWERSMDASLLRGEGLQALLDASEEVLRNHVDIVDPAMKLLAYTKGNEVEDPITNRLDEQGYHTEETILKFRLDRRFQTWAESDGFIVNTERKISRYPSVLYTFKSGTSFNVIIVMICNVIEPCDYLLDVYNLFKTRVGHYVQSRSLSGTPRKNAVAYFLEDLVGGKLSRPDDIVERGKFANVSYNGPYCLFYFGTSAHANLPEKLFMRKVEDAVTPAFSIEYDGALLVLCSNCRQIDCSHDCMGKQCPHRKSNIIGSLQNILETYGRYCVRSTPFDNLSELRIAYLQARSCYEALSASDGFPQSPEASRVLQFDDYLWAHFVSTLDAENARILRMSRAYRSLDKLKSYDDDNSTDYYPFLRCFLVQERRNSVVSQMQNMHRNNVSKRVERIEQLMKMDLDDPRQRFALLTCFNLRDNFNL